MPVRKIFIPIAVFAVHAVIQPCWAGQISLSLDTTKSTVHWTLAGNVHTVHGTFRIKEGHLAFDSSTGAATGDVVVDADSGESGNGARDKRMRKEILQTDRFREISLHPEKIEGVPNLDGLSSVRLTGKFEIHGEAHEITIPLNVQISGTTVTGTGRFSVPYLDWGMKDPSNFLLKVEKTVDVEIVAVGTVTGK